MLTILIPSKYENLSFPLPFCISLFCVLSTLYFCFNSSASEVESAKTDWGFYQIYWTPAQFAKGVDKQIKHLGGAPKYVLFFRDLNSSRGFPEEAAKYSHSRNLIPIISLELWNWSEGRKTGGLEAIVDGVYDDFFESWAQNAGTFGQSVILRFGFEMNGGWFSWGKKTKNF